MAAAVGRAGDKFQIAGRPRGGTALEPAVRNQVPGRARGGRDGLLPGRTGQVLGRARGGHEGFPPRRTGQRVHCNDQRADQQQGRTYNQPEMAPPVPLRNGRPSGARLARQSLSLEVPLTVCARPHRDLLGCRTTARTAGWSTRRQVLGAGCSSSIAPGRSLTRDGTAGMDTRTLSVPTRAVRRYRKDRGSCQIERP